MLCIKTFAPEVDPHLKEVFPDATPPFAPKSPEGAEKFAGVGAGS